MGNVQSGEEAQKKLKSLRNSRSKQDGEKDPHAPTLPPPKEYGASVTGNVPAAILDGTLAKDRRNQQDLQQVLRSELLPFADLRTTNQNDLGAKGFELETVISLLQQLKQTASPDDLIALQRALLPAGSTIPEPPYEGKDGHPPSRTPGTKDHSQQDSVDIGPLLLRKGAASPTATVDSVDLGGPTAWALASYMTTLSASKQEEPQQKPEIEPTSVFGQPASPQKSARPVIGRTRSLRKKKQHIRDSLVLASEYMTEAGRNSPYPSSARQSHEMSAGSSQTSLATSSYHSSAGSFPRSPTSTTHELRTRPSGNAYEQELYEGSVNAAARIGSGEVDERLAGPDGGMSVVDNFSKREIVNSVATSPTSAVALKSTSSFTQRGTDSGYSSGCSTHRTSRDTASDIGQPSPISRTFSVSKSMATEGIERKTSVTSTHSILKATRLSHSRDRLLKIEKITGESLEYLNYPIIGNKTQTVKLPQSSRSQLKLEKITGESLESLSYPVVGVVPPWRAFSRSHRQLRGRKSFESLAESEKVEVSRKGSLNRSRSWKGSMRDSFQLTRSAPSSRSASPERGSSEMVRSLSKKQRKKLHKQPPSSKDLPMARPKTVNAVESGFVLERTESINSSSRPEPNVEHQSKTQAPTRRPSIFRRRRKREVAPEDTDVDLTGVVVIDPALGGTPYDVAMSADNKKSVERLRSLSSSPKHPDHFASVSRPISQDDIGTQAVSRPVSEQKHDSASLAIPLSPVDQAWPQAGEMCDPEAFPKRMSVWTNEVIAAANKGLPAELPAAFFSGQPTEPPKESEPRVELSTVTTPEPSAELQSEMNKADTWRHRSSSESGRLSDFAFFPHDQNLPRPHAHPSRSATTNARPSSFPEPTFSSVSIICPAITLTSASPSPPPSPRRPKSAGNLSNTWKGKQPVPIGFGQDSADWLKQAQSWREKKLQAKANVLKSKTAQETSTASAVERLMSSSATESASREFHAEEIPHAPTEAASTTVYSLPNSPVWAREPHSGRYYDGLPMQRPVLAPGTTNRDPTMITRSQSGRQYENWSDSTYAPGHFENREAARSRRKFTVQNTTYPKAI